MNKTHILSFDDDKELQTVLKHYLEGEGYSITAVNDEKQFIEKLQKDSIDIILLDLLIPGSDGISLISFIKSKTKAPIIVVSGKTDTTEKIVCLEMGADDYITKPFEMRELSARIKAVIRRSKEGANKNLASPSNDKDKNEIVKFDGFVLDPKQFQIFNDRNESLDMTSGEFELLRALIMSPNQVLTRGQLFERTRGTEYDSFDRAVDIQIGRIRKKLGEKGSQSIKTIRNIGYMFSSNLG